MSDSVPTRSTERLRLQDKSVTLPMAAVTSLITAALAGGGGSYLTGDRIASEFREFRIEIRAQLDSIQRDATRLAQDHATAMLRVEREASERERRIRDLELWRAKEDAQRERSSGNPR